MRPAGDLENRVQALRLELREGRLEDSVHHAEDWAGHVGFGPCQSCSSLQTVTLQTEIPLDGFDRQCPLGHRSVARFKRQFERKWNASGGQANDQRDRMVLTSGLCQRHTLPGTFHCSSLDVRGDSFREGIGEQIGRPAQPRAPELSRLEAGFGGRAQPGPTDP